MKFAEKLKELYRNMTLPYKVKEIHLEYGDILSVPAKCVDSPQRELYPGRNIKIQITRYDSISDQFHCAVLNDFTDLYELKCLKEDWNNTKVIHQNNLFVEPLGNNVMSSDFAVHCENNVFTFYHNFIIIEGLIRKTGRRKIVKKDTITRYDKVNRIKFIIHACNVSEEIAFDYKMFYAPKEAFVPLRLINFLAYHYSLNPQEKLKFIINNNLYSMRIVNFKHEGHYFEFTESGKVKGLTHYISRTDLRNVKLLKQDLTSHLYRDELITKDLCL